MNKQHSPKLRYNDVPSIRLYSHDAQVENNQRAMGLTYTKKQQQVNTNFSYYVILTHKPWEWGYRSVQNDFG